MRHDGFRRISECRRTNIETKVKNINVAIYKENFFRYKHVKCAHNRVKENAEAKQKKSES